MIRISNFEKDRDGVLRPLGSNLDCPRRITRRGVTTPGRTEDQKVMRMCRKAMRNGTIISDACARVIASHWHSGQTSLLYSFSSTGAIGDLQGVIDELCNPLPADQVIPVCSLINYFCAKGVRPPVGQHWGSLWV